MKIKVYDCSDERELQDKLNQLSEDLETNNQEIRDIKFSTSHFEDENQEQIYCFSALVMYDDKITKKYEIVEEVDD